ncbi:MAG: tripartite tricarboxylate transporter substrate binding protein [Vitreoscilla sp.]|nr:tripartite tricarboxylate transporter substrate binding protein [Vitreoscilla sp.]
MAFRTKTAAALFAGLACTLASAQAPAGFPQRPIRIVVPFPAGGTADSIPRIVAEKLSARWGQPVIIDNRPGAGGNIGAEAAFHAEPDGYTLLASPPGPLAVNASLYRKLGYDVSKFVPVSLLATMPNILSVRTTMPAASVKELIAAATREPGKVSYASQGNGTTSHLSASLFQLLTHTSLLHVPYKGTAPALSDLVGGQVDMMFDNVSSSLGQYKAGRIKVLAVATAKRLPYMPEVPTMEEAGVKNFRTGTWVALVAPPNTPPEIAAAISKAVAEVIRMPEVQKRFADLGGDAAQGTQPELAAFLADESARWKDVIQRANVTVDN